MKVREAIPTHWDDVKLAEVCELITDGTHFSPKSKGGPYRYVTSRNIRFGWLDLHDCQYISEEEHQAIYRTCPVKEGDLLLTKDGANTGNAAINSLKEPFSLLSSVALVRGNPTRVLNEFLLQYFLSPIGQAQLKNQMAGLAITRLTLVTINQLKVPVPPLPEQRKIAAILGTWDEAIALTERRIAAGQRRKQGLMQRLLTGQVRFPEFVRSVGVTETPYGDLPADWQYVSIAQIAAEIGVRNTEGRDYPVLSCTKHYGLVDSLAYFGRQMFSDDTSTYKVVRRGQFAYATNHIEEGSIGHQNLHDVALISPMYTVFETDNQVNDDFLYRVLKTEKYRRIFETSTNGTVNRRGSLRWKEFSQIKVPLPSLPEQRRIAEVLAACDRELDLLARKRDALQRQKRGLMQQLLTGRVRVKGLDHGDAKRTKHEDREGRAPAG